MKILVIEDSRDVLLLLQLELAEQGYLVWAAEDAKSGLMIARRQRPDVIVSDVGLPGMDGLELIRHLRSDPQLQDTPVIALSGIGSWGEIERARSAGFDLVLVKPVSRREMAQAIERVCEPAPRPLETTTNEKHY